MTTTKTVEKTVTGQWTVLFTLPPLHNEFLNRFQPRSLASNAYWCKLFSL